MTGLPLLTALYVIPGYDFAHVGSYADLVPWCAFWSGYMTDQHMKKILDIAGTDVVIIDPNEVSARIKKREIAGLPHLTPVISNLRHDFSEGLKVFINPDSYGTIYLANAIYYKNPAIIKSYEDDIKKYFANPTKHNPEHFKVAQQTLYNNLWDLANRHDAIIESDDAPIAADASIPAGDAKIIGMVGSRVLALANCQRNACALVLNVANSPGWHVYVNGQPTIIKRANFAFISTMITQGTSLIWFIYESAAQLINYMISILALVIILLLTLRYQKSR